MFSKIAVSALSLLVVAGCNHTGGGAKANTPPPRPTYNELVNEMIALSTIASDPNTSSATPDPGTAVYEGAMGMTVGAETILGEAKVTADFVGATISGKGKNFVNDSSKEYNGKLNIAGAITTTATVNVTGTITGTLTDNSSSYPVNATFTDEKFKGANYDSLYIPFGGDFGTGTGNMSGDLFGQKQ